MENSNCYNLPFLNVNIVSIDVNSKLEPSKMNLIPCISHTVYSVQKANILINMLCICFQINLLLYFQALREGTWSLCIQVLMCKIFTAQGGDLICHRKEKIVCEAMSLCTSFQDEWMKTYGIFHDVLLVQAVVRTFRATVHAAMITRIPGPASSSIARAVSASSLTPMRTSTGMRVHDPQRPTAPDIFRGQGNVLQGPVFLKHLWGKFSNPNAHNVVQYTSLTKCMHHLHILTYSTN